MIRGRCRNGLPNDQNGDPAALEKLLRWHQVWIYNTAERSVLDADRTWLYYSGMYDPIAIALVHAAHRVEARLEEVLAGVGLSIAKFEALSVLVSQDRPISLSELAKKLIVSGTGTLREPSPADKQVCPICQITFLEFRNSGRLGCPYDYEVFRDELMPLLENIHGETRHSGKVPRRAPRNTQQQTTLIQLRNELKRAVAAEDYEAAARLRDKIKGIELEQGR